jgi:integrase
MSVYRKAYKGRDGAKAETAIYYAEFRDHLDRLQVVSGYRDKAATRELERKLRKLAATRASGALPDDEMRRWTENLPDALRDRLAAIGLITAQQVAGLRPLTELVEEWAKLLRAKDRTEEHVKLVKCRALRVFDGTGAKFWTDINAARVATFLKDLREGKARRSAQTSNFYLNAASQFCRWAVRTGLASANPLASVDGVNVKLDRRRERRALTIDELRRVLVATDGAATRDGMSGHERAVLYLLAAETGFRRKELLSLTVDSFEVADLEHATVEVRAEDAKNRTSEKQPIRAITAQIVARMLEGRERGARAFSAPTWFRSAECLRADLEAAGIAYRDEAGRFRDFHGMRATFCTNLERGGASLQAAQKLARHSTPDLTSKHYTLLEDGDKRRALGCLPNVAHVLELAAVAGECGTSPSDLQADLQEQAGKRATSCDSVRRSGDGATTLGRDRETLELSGFRGETAALPVSAGADGVLVAPPVFKTGVPDDLR